MSALDGERQVYKGMYHPGDGNALWQDQKPGSREAADLSLSLGLGCPIRQPRVAPGPEMRLAQTELGKRHTGSQRLRATRTTTRCKISHE